MTCKRSREFLEKRGIAVLEEVSASRTPYGKREALAVARRAKKLVVAKGSNVIELAMKDKPSDGQVLDYILGPTGNLRAPTIRVGDTLYVGFPKEGFASLG